MPCKSMKLPLLCLLLVGSSAAIAQPPASPAAVTPPGNTRFDASDRLAITNLFGAMVCGLDTRDPDLLASTVAPEFWAEYRVPGSPTLKVTGRDNFRAMAAKRFENFEKSGVRRRHIVAPPFFTEQTPDSARVSIYFLICTATNGKDWHPFASAIGEFCAVKRDGVWMFTSQIETPDGALDQPLTTLLPGLSPSAR